MYTQPELLNVHIHVCVWTYLVGYSLITEFLSNDCKLVCHLGPKLEINNFIILSNIIKAGTCILRQAPVAYILRQAPVANIKRQVLVANI